MSEGWEALDGSDQHIAQPPQQAVYQPSGLRQAREATGLHIAALAAALKVPVKKLEALEAGRYEELPDLTFARALASSACRHLKIDANQILGMIPLAHAPTLGGASAGVNTPFKPDQNDSGSSSMATWFKAPAVRITGAILLAALGLAFVPDWGQWPGKDLISRGQAWIADRSKPETGIAETEVVLPIAPQSVPPEAQGAGSSEAEAPASVESTESRPAALKIDTGLGEESPTRASPGSVLHLEATNESWVEVLDGAGKVQIQRMMKKGDVLDFSASPPYSVVLGRADAVSVQVRGQAFDVSPYARNSVARFQVK
jgi:cytoskeleton protein RodZ